MQLTEKLKEVAIYSSWDLNWGPTWDKCTGFGLEIFQQLTVKQCKMLAYCYVEEYQGIFSGYHPEANWVKKYFQKLSEHGNVPNIGLGKFVLPQTGSEFNTPGSNGFVKELESLWELLEAQQVSDDEVSEKSLNIVVGIIMCKLDERWGSEQPVEWNRWYVSAQTGELEVQERLKFIKAPAVIRILTMEWISLANRLQILLDVPIKYEVTP